MSKLILIFLNATFFFISSLKCEASCIKDTAAFKLRKNTKQVRFKNESPFKDDLVLIDTISEQNIKVARFIPYSTTPKETLACLNVIDYELPIETSPDRYPIRKYFDLYSQYILDENPDVTITQLFIDGMARNPYIIIKLEGYSDSELPKKISSLWFGIRLNRKIMYMCFIFKGKKIDSKKEEALITYLKDFEVIEE